MNSVAELVFEQVRSLPEAAAREVLDFVTCLQPSPHPSGRGCGPDRGPLVMRQVGPADHVAGAI